jgi:hypothetical protein
MSLLGRVGRGLVVIFFISSSAFAIAGGMFLLLHLRGWFASPPAPPLALGKQIIVSEPAPGVRKEVFYSENVPESEAHRLIRYLKRKEWFGEVDKGATVQLSRQESIWIVSFVMKRDSWNKPDVVEGCRSFRQQLSEELYDGQMVIIRLCDPLLVIDSGVQVLSVQRVIDH